MKATVIILVLTMIIGVLLFVRAWNAPLVFKVSSTNEVCGCMTTDYSPSLEQCEDINLGEDLHEIVWVSTCN